MKLADGLRKHGFRKWYERELLQSHGHMALTFVCTIGVFGAFEALRGDRSATGQLISVASLLLCGAVGLWALRRYLFLLAHAEGVANQANCPGCGTYARFKLLQADRDNDRVRVGCKKCAQEWVIDS